MACYEYGKYGKMRKRAKLRIAEDGTIIKKKRCCSDDIIELKLAARTVTTVIKKSESQILKETYDAKKEYFLSYLKPGLAMTRPNDVSPVDVKETVTDFGAAIIIDLKQCGAIYLKRDPYIQIDHIVGFNPGFLHPDSLKIYMSDAFRIRIKNMFLSGPCAGVMKKDPYGTDPNRIVPNPERYEESYYGVTPVEFKHPESQVAEMAQKVGASSVDYDLNSWLTLSYAFVFHKTGDIYLSLPRNGSSPRWIDMPVLDSIKNDVFKIGNINDAGIDSLITRTKKGNGGPAVNDVTCQPLEALRYFLGTGPYRGLIT